MMKLSDYQQQFMAKICGDTELPERLQIYRSASQVIRHNALRQIFPNCEKIVGTEYFAYLTQEFITHAPSVTVALQEQANAFCQFIATHAILQQLPYLADFVRLEAIWQQVFNSPALIDTKAHLPLTETDLISAPPYAQLFHSDYPLIEIWHMCQENYRGNFDLTQASSSALLILQINDELRLLPLTEIEQRVLTLLKQPMTYTNLQNKYKADYNESILLIVESMLARRAILRNQK